ncbi:hypothetical protein QBC46DRAFT_340068 [Diplogelasinospora grovesii]|uniref:Uncharacterized protein n=1 Tax=Diplogelasinospora grovesii TaxID=303347 RepID=A0AAN6NB35_9PEZI|nr:hypothetical protein QBC46DRAFT_340068 [Diplogelasinospora grovesii]
MAAYDAGESTGGARDANHDISIIINDEGGAERVAMEDTRRLDSPSTTADFDDMISQLHDDDPEHYNHSRPKTFRKLSNSSSIISDIFRHPDISEDRLRGKIRKANVNEHRRRSSIDFLIGILRDTLPLHSSPPRSDIPTPQAKTDDVGSLGSKRKKKKKEKWHPPSFWFIFRRERKQQRQHEAEGKKKAPGPTTIEAQLSMKDLAVVPPISIATAENTHPRGAHDVGESSMSASKLPLPVIVETRSGPLRRSFERAAAITGLSPVEESRESVDSLLHQLIRCAAGDTDAPRPSSLPNPPDEILDKEPLPGQATIAEQMLMRRESFPLRITGDSAVAAATPPPSPRRRRAGPALRRRGSLSGLTSSIEGSGSPARKHCRPPRPQPSIEGDNELLIADGIRSTPRRRRQRWGGWSIESNLSRAGTRTYSIADSIASNSSEPVIADATTAQGGYLPQVVVVERPASSSNRQLVVTNDDVGVDVEALNEHTTTAHQLSPTPVMLVADIRPSSPLMARPSSTVSESAQCRQQQHQKLRSDSHLELARRYKELGLSHRRELATLLGRMEQLERHNASWLNAITPLFDKLAQSLGQRCCGRCNSSSMRENMEDQEALCDASHLRGRTEPGITSAMGRGVWFDVGMDDNDDFAYDVPQQHRRHSAPPRACNRSVDLDHGQSVPSNRRRVRFSDSHLAAQQQRYTPSSPTGLDALEPLMRELVMGVDIADN